ncbi:WxL domain-containing protein [Enterococcus faecalis]|uniref:WxL domain-containing protein n=1 Tax=Enterococcus faecalis TaxID=1351 RepID=UPI002DB5AB21|nr:WxL domain-containing protein [Enterococcus faecalis]MEB7427083.1 WxL domain-containing protein [Enterococcus faecalis]
MKKKMMASLLVCSAVVGASLAPLSAQATTTGNTPVQVEFGGGVLPDHDNNDGGSVDPDPSTPNTDFDLLAVPRSFNFPLVKINDDLSAIKESSSVYRDLMVGDVRGTKEGWHVTGELTKMSNGTDELAGDINFGLKVYYADYITHITPETPYYGPTSILNGVNIANDPTAPSATGTSMKIGGGATTLSNATIGKGQGTWAVRFENMTLNVTTPYQQIKAGAYTGNITWNLVAGPSI